MDVRTHVRARLMECGSAERDLAVTGRGVAIHRRKEEWAADVLS
jgi:hypothetical protein